MKKFQASEYPYTILKKTQIDYNVYPYLRSTLGNRKMWCVSPYHGRSFVVGMHQNGRYVVSKGNGLSYSQYSLLHTGEFGDDTFGLLLEQDAIRDFLVGAEINKLGIKTNQMEYVIRLEEEIQLSNGHILKPVLLQYSVECPYRICDVEFHEDILKNEVNKWERFNDLGFDKSYLIAANVLIKNLKILHGKGILHNAISTQNYTWALELLDFELACSPTNPYGKEDERRHVRDLFNREILYTYDVINYIAFSLNELIDYNEVDELFKYYGFDLSMLNIRY